MLNEKDRRIIVDNVRKNIRDNYQDIEDFDDYATKEINREIRRAKLKYNSNEKIIIYDENFNPERDSKISIIFEDFIGKNKRLDVFNSCEKIDLKRSSSRNINELNGIFCRKVIFNLNCFFANFSNCNKKNFKYFLVLFFNYLFLSFYNLLILLLFTAFNLVNYIIFLVYRVFLFIKYKIFRRFYLKFMNIFLSFPIVFVKQILIFFKEIANILANIFGIVNNTFRIFNKTFNNNIYSNIITAPVNRDQRSNEHRNILDKINKKAKEMFEKYNLENERFIEKFIFSKASYKPFASSKINNIVLRDYIKTMEQLEINDILESVKKNIEADVKNKIYRKELSIKKQVVKDKNARISAYEKNINKHLKKIFNITNIDSSIFDEKEIKKGL